GRGRRLPRGGVAERDVLDTDQRAARRVYVGAGAPPRSSRTASVIVVTPVRIVRSRSGANLAVCGPGGNLPTALSFSNSPGSEAPMRKNTDGTPAVRP